MSKFVILDVEGVMQDMIEGMRIWLNSLLREFVYQMWWLVLSMSAKKYCGNTFWKIFFKKVELIYELEKFFSIPWL